MKRIPGSKILGEKMKNKENLDKIFEKSLDTDIKEPENKNLSLEDVTKAIEIAESEKPPKKIRKGRKSKEQIEQEKKAEDVKLILRSSFAYALIGLTNSLAVIMKSEKWAITDTQESEFLAEATIQYLDERFPEWEKASPELNLAMAWSSYFIKRLLPEEKTANKEE